jgi:hypothetical protein
MAQILEILFSLPASEVLSHHTWVGGVGSGAWRLIQASGIMFS